jgi:hypothetical protein
MKPVHLISPKRLVWLLVFMLLGWVQGVQALGSERFLERLSSEIRDGRLVVTVHFIQRLEYLSHSPSDFGERVEVRLRAPGAATPELVATALGEGLKQLTPARSSPVRSVQASGNLDTDPGVSIRFDRAHRFQVRAGRNDRSLDILLEPEASEAETEPLPEARLPVGTTPEERQLADQFRQARLAFNAGQYQRANAIYDKIIATGIEPYVREAIVALGVARAERGQDAQARAQFERYLEDYPDGPEARRVERLLESLLDGEESTADAAAAPAETGRPFEVFGSFDQFYLLDRGKVEGEGSETHRSSLLSSANLNWQGRTGNFDVSGRFSGSYDYSFLSDRDSPTRVSYLYLDLASVDGRHEGRLGRQRLPGSGVLGYFDGLQYQFRYSDRQALRYVVGSPIRSLTDGVDTDRWFNGLAWDLNGPDERWLLSLYGLYQRFDGKTDRRALGAEGRYLGDSVTAYSLLDYDTYFEKLNIFYLFGTWRIQEGTVASLTLDHRRSPGLALSNALYSLGVDNFDDLGPDLSDDELKRLAEDRSLIYRSLYASLTQQLNDRWQLLLDGGLYSLRDDSNAPDSDGLDSDNWYVYGQVMGTGLFKTGDLYSAGLRYTDADRMDITSVLLRARLPLPVRWQITPQLRVDFRDRDDGNDQRMLIPSLFTRYRLTKRTSLELDAGVEFSRIDEDLGGDRDDRFFYLSAGYRHDF